MGQGVFFCPTRPGALTTDRRSGQSPRANFNTPPDLAGHKLLFDTIVQGPPALDFLVSSRVRQRACCRGATSPSTWGRLNVLGRSKRCRLRKRTRPQFSAGRRGRG